MKPKEPDSLAGWRLAYEALEQRMQARTRELLEANEKLRQANTAKTQFVANMSHEMRTPLAAILGYAEMMYDARQNLTERMSCIGRIRQNVKNLTELIDDILDLSRVEAGRIAIQPVTFSLLPELGELLSALQSKAWKKRLSFDVRFDGAIPETVTTDPLRFRQVLLNVINNAVKFTERGGVLVTAYLDRSSDNRRLCFEVVDTGIGIEPAVQASLFQPFVQGDNSLHRAHGGSGLGLVLSRKIARALGGDVTLERTQPGRGSTFKISLDPGPLEGVSMKHEVAKEDLCGRYAPPLAIDERKLEGMRILLVEDAADIQVLISHFLRRSGAHVEVAENGYEAIKKARVDRYDLVLMDIQMPVLNGYEATEQLHREGFTSPIVALTAHAMKGMREKCLAAGCSDYLTKPINTSALIELTMRYRPNRSTSPN